MPFVLLKIYRPQPKFLIIKTIKFYNCRYTNFIKLKIVYKIKTIMFSPYAKPLRGLTSLRVKLGLE